MGKGNDFLNEYLGTTKRDKLAESLGFDDSLYKGSGTGRPGGGDYREQQENKQAAQEAFLNNNYHVQSAIDHGRATGNKRADKLSKELKSPEDFQKLYKYMKKGHEHGGNGGNFSSMGDMMASQDYRFDKNMDQLASAGGGGDGGTQAMQEPYEPMEKTDEHLEAEQDYLANDNPFGDMPSAMDSYNETFNNTTEAGRQGGSAMEYVLNRHDAKMDWLGNRFMPYMEAKNNLARHESHNAAMDAIGLAGHLGLKPPELDDPYDTYSKYKEDIEDI